MGNEDSVAAFYRNAPDYDWEYRKLTADIPFYIRLCADLARDEWLLDLCCGTGRETIPLANWSKITAVDITPAMIDLCRQKLARQSPEIRRRINLVLGDIRNVGVGFGRYKLAIIPFNSFLHLLTTEDQLAALRNIYQHLASGGYFIADIFCPSVERLAQAQGPNWVREERAVENLETSQLLVRQAVVHYDPGTQIQTNHFYYYIYEAGGEQRLLRRYWSPLEIRMIFPAEWRLLLRTAGFTIVEEWGDYERTPFQSVVSATPSSAKMLFLCRKEE